MYNSKKLLAFVNIEGVFQPNIREKGICSMPRIKHAYPLRQGVQCPGLCYIATDKNYFIT